MQRFPERIEMFFTGKMLREVKCFRCVSFTFLEDFSTFPLSTIENRGESGTDLRSFGFAHLLHVDPF